ncbi:hypothetical protein SporoP33_00600 [Sporosarcina sp. P33]|nr:hypothetical protein SporoP33_00600 [Sporosarcina sp. P33]
MMSCCRGDHEAEIVKAESDIGEKNQLARAVRKELRRYLVFGFLVPRQSAFHFRPTFTNDSAAL